MKTTTDSNRSLHGKVCLLLQDERGMIAISSLVLLLTAMLLIGLTINLSQVTHRRIEMQTAADAVTSAGGTMLARGMNALTATNHLMGEMMSLVIIHEAIGGKKHERGINADDGVNSSLHAKSDDRLASPAMLKNNDRRLATIYRGASAFRTLLKFPPHQRVFELVHDRRSGRSGIHAEATLLDCSLNLKQWLQKIYAGKALAGALIATNYGPLVATGRALEAAMEPLELKTEQEYRTLKAVDVVARQLLPAKKLLRDVLLPSAKRQTTAIVQVTPRLAQRAAEELGRLNSVEGSLFPAPGQLKLPVQMDPLALAQTLPLAKSDVPEPGQPCDCPAAETAITRDQIVKVTQLARATFPWVNYHRQPLLDMMAATMNLAEAKEVYFHWSNGYSKRVLDEQQQGRSWEPDSHLGLYVLQGYTGPDKGYEDWNMAENSELADDLFTFIGLAAGASPHVIGGQLFRQLHPDGLFSFSSGLLYNANDQQRPQHRIDLRCKRILPVRQANTGMDTLNWYPGSQQESAGCELRPRVGDSREHRPFELLGIGLPAEYPRIQVNWQWKLIPSTTHRVGQLRNSRPRGVFRRLLDRLPATIPAELMTH